MYLENINGPADIKKLEVSQLQVLADETRAALINKISKAGGHQGPNLGVVELTVAFHYVFDSPKDKIVFDVSHQCYPHKILTGRKEAFLDETHFGDVTGYTNPNESEHDMFIVGHTSTSVSLALGLAKGRDLNQRSENIIALIGDGSLSGGEALEALDYAGEYDRNLIIIVNDNDQSIAENHGGLYKTLKKLRESKGTADDNLFRAMGLDYRYLDDGHDTAKLVELFESVKNIDHPVVLHIHTIKGKGLPYAEKDRESWHAGGPFHVEDGSPLQPYEGGESVVFNCLKEMLDTNGNAIVLNAATPMGLGFVQGVREEYVDRGQFIDVGIAEENAVAMAGGIARNGGTAVFGTFAPFYQRTYDQMSHDVCLNDSPATFLILSPGAYGMNSNTHSYSGFETIWWANTYPDEVKAVLSIDMGFPNMMKAMSEKIPLEKKKAMVEKTRKLMQKIEKRGLLAKMLRNSTVNTSGLLTGNELSEDEKKTYEEVYYKNIASEAVFDESILAEENAIKAESTGYLSCPSCFIVSNMRSVVKTLSWQEAAKDYAEHCNAELHIINEDHMMYTKIPDKMASIFKSFLEKELLKKD